MKCRICESEIKDGEKYCRNCGADISDEKQKYSNPGGSDASVIVSRFKIEIILFLVILVLGITSGVVYSKLVPKDEKTEEVTEAAEEIEEDTSDSENTPEQDAEEAYAAYDPDYKPKETEHTYRVVVSDKSWDEARDAAEEDGGYLAVITSRAEEKKIIKKIKKTGIDFAWIGAYTEMDDDGVTAYWITGEDFDYSNWFSNANGVEPSGRDADGALEDSVMMWNVGGKWTWNDQRNDPAGEEELSEMFSGKMGYVIEYEE
jgi:hypothetical protein